MLRKMPDTSNSQGFRYLGKQDEDSRNENIEQMFVWTKNEWSVANSETRMAALVEAHMQSIEYMTNDDDANQALRDGVGTSTREHGEILRLLKQNTTNLNIHSNWDNSKPAGASQMQDQLGQFEVRLPNFMSFGLNYEFYLEFAQDEVVNAQSQSALLVGYDTNDTAVVWCRLSSADTNRTTSFGKKESGQEADRFIRTFEQLYKDISLVPYQLEYQVHKVEIAGNVAIDNSNVPTKDAATKVGTVTSIREEMCLLPYHDNANYQQITLNDKDQLEIYATKHVLTSNKPYNIWDTRSVTTEVVTSAKYRVADRAEPSVALDSIGESDMDSDSPLVEYLDTFGRAITNMISAALR